ncbi:atp-Dependent DNA helicase [Arthrobacter sp. Hiyo1]|nr:atp-Dependent DNA helicase [Arthrobacter sp. Hiyo1]
MECLRREFEVQGIPYEIVGLGGLLDTPEVVDLVAALRVLADPGRSDALMRLLAGARWRIGTADLMAFRDWSQFLARRRSHGGSGDGGTADDASNADESPMETVVESDITDAASLVEALDFLPRPGWTSGHGRSLSPAALDRLGRLSAELRNLRGFIGDDLSTLIGEVERAMLLDIEVAAKPGRASTRPAATWTHSMMPRRVSCRLRSGLISWPSWGGLKRPHQKKVDWTWPTQR